MTAPVILGIDTSCYTTSLAIVKGCELLGDVRKMLPVPEGARGLRQSEGFYHHHRHLPELAKKLVDTVPEFRNLTAIAYSAAPRSVEGSYMPVFTAGEDFAKTLSVAFGIPLIPLSHQEGHIRAAAWASDFDESEPFLAVHLSGGTTEILRVTCRKNRYHIDILGGSKDISAGMLIDRAGVMMGYPFPAGRYLDQAAIENQCKDPVFPISVKQGWINFSGLENVADRHFSEFKNSAETATGLLSAVSRSVGKSLTVASEATGINRVLFSGGVSASQFLRKFLMNHKQFSRIDMTFCPGQYSVDNAVGIALMGADIKLGTFI